MIEVDEPIFEKLADDPMSCSAEDFEEAFSRIEGITDVYTEDGIKVFGMY